MSRRGMCNDLVGISKWLGSLLRAIQLPWLEVANWSFDPRQLRETGLVGKMDGEVACVDVPFACAPGGGQTPADVDFMVVTCAARPCLECAGA
eukprot:4402505-Pyramimonas_sp.AAC.1